MTRTMTMTLKTMGADDGAGTAATMARTRADGTQIVRRVVGFAIFASGFVAIATQIFAHLAGR